jgi:hypothetical protein
MVPSPFFFSLFAFLLFAFAPACGALCGLLPLDSEGSIASPPLPFAEMEDGARDQQRGRLISAFLAQRHRVHTRADGKHTIIFIRCELHLVQMYWMHIVANYRVAVFPLPGFRSSGIYVAVA